MSGRVILITGVMAAGKSTVAQALAERLPRSVHLRGDAFRRMIVNGRAEPGPVLTEEARAQLHLRYRIAVSVARQFAEEGFTVVYQDIILGDTLRDVAGWFEDTQLDVFVLAPDAAVARRGGRRNKTGYPSPGDIPFFDRVLRQETPKVGTWLDTTTMTVAETADRILRVIGKEPT